MSRDLALRLLLSVSIVAVGLAVAVALLLLRSSGPTPLAEALSDPEVRQEVVDELVAQSDGIFDSFPDPDVGRVLQPGLEKRPVRGGVLSSNRWGLRERDYELVKPEGTLRVVIVGDSYVHGNGVAPDARLGHPLRAMLEEAGLERPVECLHMGIPSWNLVAEAEFVRRQLGWLQPDLVVQVAVPNDLDDVSGVRGFGAMAAASPQRAERAGSIVHRNFPRHQLGLPTRNLLVHGLDHESRTRYREAASSMLALAEALESRGSRYLLLLNWLDQQPTALDRFEEVLGEQRIVTMPASFYEDGRYRVSESDGHWNADGHRQVARYLYACLRARDLLAPHELPVREETEALRRRWQSRVEGERRDFQPLDVDELASAIDFRALDAKQGRQIHGGIFPAGAGPYASVLLRNDGARELAVEGRFPPDPGLAGARLRVYVEEQLVETVDAVPAKTVSLLVDLPGSMRDRPVLNVRLECDDYVYRGRDLRTAISFLPARLSLR